ncbi:DUF4229 domain-containing protein [Subtercola boreus]|uniref:DUF4229 domain-containing protein n=1 Tax=Subtercola boreus TaxID=120213 RepID=UPI000E2A385E|nr:DUF4229 domain-containing protein [Subtercola boreus]
MKTGRTWLVYTLIRLGIFVVVLVVLLLTQMTPWIAAALAAVISLCASYIFLRKPREELAAGLYEARHGEGRAAKRAPEKAGSDEENEDAVVDGAAVDGAAVDGAAVDGTAVDGAVVDRAPADDQPGSSPR